MEMYSKLNSSNVGSSSRLVGHAYGAGGGPAASSVSGSRYGQRGTIVPNYKYAPSSESGTWKMRSKSLLRGAVGGHFNSEFNQQNRMTQHQPLRTNMGAGGNQFSNFPTVQNERPYNYDYGNLQGQSVVPGGDTSHANASSNVIQNYDYGNSPYGIN